MTSWVYGPPGSMGGVVGLDRLHFVSTHIPFSVHFDGVDGPLEVSGGSGAA